MGRSIVYYNIYPGVIFWICSIVNIMFFIGNLVSLLMLRDSFGDFLFKVVLANGLLLLIETLEYQCHGKWCSKRIEKMIYGNPEDTYEIT